MRQLSPLIIAVFSVSACGIGLCINDSYCPLGNAFGVSNRSLTLAAIEIDDSEITVSWPAASGGTAPYSYALYYSTTSNLDSIANTKTNGTLAGTVTDATSFQITSITIDKDYYFNVIVTDASGTELAYNMRSPFCGGTGVSGDEYEICDLGSLQYAARHPTESMILTSDIEAANTQTWNSGAGFKPIGDTLVSPFSGTFDGDDFSIRALFIYRPTASNVGLFGVLYDGDIRNLQLEQVSISGNGAVGGAVGRIYGSASVLTVSSISGVAVDGSIQGDDAIGGVVGDVRPFPGQLVDVQISECASSATVTARIRAGGLVGRTSSAVGNIVVRRSSGRGNVITTEGVAGGLIGVMSTPGSVSDSYAWGSVSGMTQMIGGLIGSNSIADVSRTYATGTAFLDAAGTGQVGGLIGYNQVGNVTASYATGNVSGPALVGSVVGQLLSGSLASLRWYDHALNPANCYQGGDVGCSTQPLAWFYDTNNYGAAGLNWDFSTVWKFPAIGGLPILEWQVEE